MNICSIIGLAMCFFSALIIALFYCSFCDPSLLVVFWLALSGGLLLASMLLGVGVEPLSVRIGCCGWRLNAQPVCLLVVGSIALLLYPGFFTALVLASIFAASIAYNKLCCCRDLGSSLVHFIVVISVWTLVVLLAITLRTFISSW